VGVVLDDADAALVTGIEEMLEELLDGERMGIKPADDLGFGGIELTGARHAHPRGIGTTDPVTDGLDIQSQTVRELPGGQVVGAPPHGWRTRWRSRS
jgi:hypothetical protein